MSVITSQPGHVQQGTREMSSGLFGCLGDIKSCCYGYFCMPCLMCSNASRLGEHQCVSICCPGGQVALRTKLRTQYGIQGSICSDSCAVAFCGACFECQTARELDHVGL
ncbi:placenta-specific gene 8 protein-like [Lineus longissimus]|uniref:placenta-specific gene 8 protein-like n=1 Tax=Lineus longissimus TaxID=88925 RepID=UPI002B4EF536